MKENLVIFALGVAWAALTAVFTFALALDKRVIIIETNFPFMERQIANCVKNDIYQIEKMHMLDKLPK